ncbi:hypothetical protein ACC772_39715, partial [Rhizobium ruizarguesonis]
CAGVTNLSDDKFLIQFCRLRSLSCLLFDMADYRRPPEPTGPTLEMLSTLAADASLATLVSTAKLRWRI